MRRHEVIVDAKRYSVQMAAEKHRVSERLIYTMLSEEVKGQFSAEEKNKIREHNEAVIKKVNKLAKDSPMTEVAVVLDAQRHFDDAVRPINHLTREQKIGIAHESRDTSVDAVCEKYNVNRLAVLAWQQLARRVSNEAEIRTVKRGRKKIPVVVNKEKPHRSFTKERKIELVKELIEKNADITKFSKKHKVPAHVMGIWAASYAGDQYTRKSVKVGKRKRVLAGKATRASRKTNKALIDQHTGKSYEDFDHVQRQLEIAQAHTLSLEKLVKAMDLRLLSLEINGNPLKR